MSDAASIDVCSGSFVHSIGVEKGGPKMPKLGKGEVYTNIGNYSVTLLAGSIAGLTIPPEQFFGRLNPTQWAEFRGRIENIINRTLNENNITTGTLSNIKANGIHININGKEQVLKLSAGYTDEYTGIIDDLAEIAFQSGLIDESKIPSSRVDPTLRLDPQPDIAQCLQDAEGDAAIFAQNILSGRGADEAKFFNHVPTSTGENSYFLTAYRAHFAATVISKLEEANYVEPEGTNLLERLRNVYNHNLMVCKALKYNAVDEPPEASEAVTTVRRSIDTYFEEKFDAKTSPQDAVQDLFAKTNFQADIAALSPEEYLSLANHIEHQLRIESPTTLSGIYKQRCLHCLSYALRDAWHTLLSDKTHEDKWAAQAKLPLFRDNLPFVHPDEGLLWDYDAELIERATTELGISDSGARALFMMKDEPELF